jgi:hypothetical protein
VIPGYSLLLVCVLPLQSAHEAAGAAGIRRSPRPLLGGRFINGSGALRGEAVNACLMATNAPHSQSSSPAKAGDPVFRGSSDGIERPQRTGYPACAGYDGSWWSGAVAVMVRSEATKQSILSLRLDGLLRGACHRARIRATRWLAMTASWLFEILPTPSIHIFSPQNGSDEAIQTPSFRDGPQDQTSDVQLHIGESRDSGFDASHRPGMTQSDSGLLRPAGL